VGDWSGHSHPNSRSHRDDKPTSEATENQPPSTFSNKACGGILL
jgi:hypothetical protein